MHRKSVVAAVLSLVGLLTAASWTLFVLPAAAVSAGPVPGREALLLGLLVVPPSAASASLLAGGILGVRARRVRGPRFLTPSSFAFLLVALLGGAAAAYTVILVLNLIGVTHL